MHIEPLENRQLLSASLHSAAKTKPTIPNILGEFVGVGNETKPIHATGNLQLNVNTESTKGVLAGTSANTTENKTATFTGKITAKDAVKLKIFGTDNKLVFTFTGKYSPTAGNITGTYKGPATKTAKASSGTFTLARLTA